MLRKALRFGRQQHLVGVVHEPDEAVAQPIGILIWNTGIAHRIGPFRVHVDIAEKLCLAGFYVLRFDLSQQGDSDTVDSQDPVQEIFYNL